VDRLMDELGGDVSDPQVEAAIEAWVGDLLDAEGAKLDGAIGYVSQMAMESEAARREAAEWVDRAVTRERRAERIKAALVAHLLRTGRSKVVTPAGRTLAAVKNSDAPLLCGDDPTEVPERFRKVVVTVNRAAVKAALKAGEDVPFAALGERGHHLRVR
jgi:hypothetical protein